MNLVPMPFVDILKARFPEIYDVVIDYNVPLTTYSGRNAPYDMVPVAEHPIRIFWSVGVRRFVYTSKPRMKYEGFLNTGDSYSSEFNELMFYILESVKFMKDETDTENIWFDISK